MTLYLAGPMTGLPELNMPAFNAMAKALRAVGHTVMNPAENFGGRTDQPREAYMRLDYADVLSCQAVALLPEWRVSVGTLSELYVAKTAGVPVVDAPALADGALCDVPLTVLGLAKKLLVALSRAKQLPAGTPDEISPGGVKLVRCTRCGRLVMEGQGCDCCVDM